MQAAQTLNVITLDPLWEDRLQQGLCPQRQGTAELRLAPGLEHQLVQALQLALAYCQAEGYLKIALLVDPRVRRQVRRLIERPLPHLPVLSYAEIAPGFCVNSLYTVAA